MSYKFPHIENQIYPKTFLKDVHVLLDFDIVNKTDDILEGLRTLYKNHFNLNDVFDEDGSDRVEVYSEDDTVRFVFGWSNCALIMRTPAYKSYSFAKPLLSIIVEYLETLGVKELNKVVMWKYNELEYEINGDGSAAVAMNGVFSRELLEGNMTNEDVEAQQSLTRWEKTVTIQDKEDTNSEFIFEFGFKCHNSDQLKGVVTLKSTIQSIDITTKVEDLNSRLDSYNAVLDDAFHWSVQNMIINEMKKQL